MENLQNDLNFQEGYRIAKLLDENPCPSNCPITCQPCIASAIDILAEEDRERERSTTIWRSSITDIRV
jgi:hypothetical protein